MSASRAVLWDMDGTLIDSEEFHWIAWRNTLALEGITITREQFLSSFGQRDSAPLGRRRRHLPQQCEFAHNRVAA